MLYLKTVIRSELYSSYHFDPFPCLFSFLFFLKLSPNEVETGDNKHSFDFEYL